ncbi:MAG: hypothetical protein V2A56_11825 [bacterium]
MRSWWAILFITLLFPFHAADAQKDSVSVRMVAGNLREAIANRQVVNLIGEYSLYNWLFTRDIVIDEKARPHSHPVLTLNASYLQEDKKALAIFLHQEFRWYLDQNARNVNTVVKELMKRPDQLIPNITQTIDNDSLSWLNLLACTMETDALKQTLGETNTDSLLTWRMEQSPLARFYKASLEHGEAIHRQMVRFRLGLPLR